jgi:hypothetical protein
LIPRQPKEKSRLDLRAAHIKVVQPPNKPKDLILDIQISKVKNPVGLYAFNVFLTAGASARLLAHPASVEPASIWEYGEIATVGTSHLSEGISSVVDGCVDRFIKDYRSQQVATSKTALPNVKIATTKFK